MSWTSPAGGLRYHWRAARYRRSLWRDFRQALSGWLTAWAPPERELILIGPSAGYCLDLKFLSRFERLCAVEPDPLARRLLQVRTKHPRLEFHRDDFFTSENPHGDLARFDAFLKSRPQSAVLFCNFLGQLRLLLEDEHEERVLSAWKSRLTPLLSGRSWASFHDRVSGTPPPALGAQPLLTAEQLSDSDLVNRCFDGRTRGEVFDHLTEGFFSSALEHAYFAWQLTPGRWHLVEGVRAQRRTQPAAR